MASPLRQCVTRRLFCKYLKYLLKKYQSHNHLFSYETSQTVAAQIAQSIHQLLLRFKEGHECGRTYALIYVYTRNSNVCREATCNTRSADHLFSTVPLLLVTLWYPRLVSKPIHWWFWVSNLFKSGIQAMFFFFLKCNTRPFHGFCPNHLCVQWQ